ncbi:MAG: alpha/beta hydrolase [Synechococcus sp.]
MSTRHACRRRLLALTTSCGLGILSLGTPAQAAVDVALVSGAFRRSIQVSDIAHLAKTEEPRGLLSDLLKLSSQEPTQVAELLNKNLDVPLVLSSRLMNTRIGEALIRRIAQIIYPITSSESSVSVPAIRAAVIEGLQRPEGLTAVSFLEAYPNPVMAVNLPALFTVIEKAESIAGLVQFFSDSPLDGLKEPNP